MFFRVIDAPFFGRDSTENEVGVVNGVSVVPIAGVLGQEGHQFICIFSSVLMMAQDEAFLGGIVQGVEAALFIGGIGKVVGGGGVARLRSCREALAASE